MPGLEERCAAAVLRHGKLRSPHALPHLQQLRPGIINLLLYLLHIKAKGILQHMGDMRGGM